MRSLHATITSFCIILFAGFCLQSEMSGQITGKVDSNCTVEQLLQADIDIAYTLELSLCSDPLSFESELPCNDDILNNEDNIQEIAEHHHEDSSVYIPLSQFTYAGDERVTIDGSLPRNTTKIRPLPLIGLASIYLGITTALHIYQVNTFWDSTTTFRFIEDGDYALYADKFGHAWGTYINAYLASEALMGAGLSWEAATLGGAGIALAYQTYVEVMDGYGKTWGFSWSDMYANFAGLAWFLGQHYVPFLQNFTYKSNFFPPPWFGRLTRESAETFLDDYSGWTFTLAVDVHNLLPNNVKKYWPSWLNIDIGHAVRDLRYRQGESVYTLGLDINPVRLLPDGPNLWKWFKQGFNYVKIPAPAIEFGDVTRFRLLYPFQLQIGPIHF
ncbi:MAG: DUF2279 domain-containing protein [Candidatus Kapaibacterium sp.]|jgi:hypothetical protein